MDEMDALERQIADVSRRVVGPPRPVDAMSVVRSSKTTTPERQVGSLRSLATVVAAASFVALVGGAQIGRASCRERV